MEAGCLSTDLRRFLETSDSSTVHGAAGHQLLRKLLSICTGKGELSPRQPPCPPEAGEGAWAGQGAGVRPTPAPEPRVLRPRRRPAREQPSPYPSPSTDSEELPAPTKRTRSSVQRLAAAPSPTRRQRARQAQQQQQAARQPQQQQQATHQKGQQQQQGPADAAAAAAADAALCSDLLSIVRRGSGVVLALALHAMHIWSQGSLARMEACLLQGVVPELVQVLAAVLGESGPSMPTAAYAASMAVILLRTLSRSGEAGMGAFVSCGGVATLLRLLPALREDRARCLALYLLSDVTRRSGDALGQAVDAGGVPLVVTCLRQPLGESTKFAALLINRWCLLAPLGGEFRGAGAMEGLLCVLRRQHSAASAPPAPEEPARVLLSEVSAYSLSALSILGQEDQVTVRALLLGCRDNLAAVTRAMTDYERSFQGTGFPHALMSSLLEGPEGCSLVAQVVACAELLPAWLSLRQVGWELVERSAQPDVAEALSQLPAEVQGDVAQSLALMLPHSRAFLALLSSPDRLAVLTRGAMAELLATSAPADCPMPSAVASAVAPMSVSSSSASHLTQACLPLSSALPEAPAAAPAAGARAAAAAEAAANDPEQGDSCREEEQPEREQLARLDSSKVEEGTAEGRLAAAPLSQPGSGELQLQRGVSVIPEAIVELEQESQQQQQQQQGQQGQQGPGPTEAAPACPSPLAAAGAPAPYTTALRRLLAAWASERAMAAAASAAGPKRGRDDEGAAAQQAKRGRFAFSRADVNVPRYDTLTFLVGGRPFHAVGFVLEAHSPLLRSLLGTLCSLAEPLPMPCIAGFDADRMYRLFGWAVEYCYTGAVEGLGPESALDLWSLAEFLQMDGLQRVCEAAAEGAGALLGPRYALGLAYPSGARLRLAVAREALELLAAQGPLPADATTAGAVEGAAVAAGWELGPQLAALAAAHPSDLAADLAQALAAELQAL